ncbi:fibrinogen and fibronectin [Culex quinquefasciatus]|uniref:Fibrinogen and fibronectin n=1 Tax=Culex quinquefasciatus TaxID=7176 RepID=B0VZM0_CULQU|nr:fibrinogen and fibronectin [Culex quinquefasciatus]|eukprot:XP_001841904.1 fibrinogen and fibronectin [Culex quinquefasciatus]
MLMAKMDYLEYKNWTEYKNGFGDLNGEFWLGLDKIHVLTKTKVRELLIQVVDFAGNVYHSKYGAFAVGSEDEKFDLKSSLVYQSGNMGDSLTQHKGRKFTTYDSDNDAYGPGNCAGMYHGAWWYNQCHNRFLELQVEIKEQIESVLLKQEKSERAVLEQTSKKCSLIMKH